MLPNNKTNWLNQNTFLGFLLFQDRALNVHENFPSGQVRVGTGIYPLTWNNQKNGHGTVCTTENIRQLEAAAMIPEEKEINEVSPAIVPVYCLEGFHAPVPGGRPWAKPSGHFLLRRCSWDSGKARKLEFLGKVLRGQSYRERKSERENENVLRRPVEVSAWIFSWSWISTGIGGHCISQRQKHWPGLEVMAPGSRAQTETASASTSPTGKPHDHHANK